MPMDDMNLKDAAFSGLYGVAFVALGRLLKMRTNPRPLLRKSLLWELPYVAAASYLVWSLATDFEWGAPKVVIAWILLGYLGPEWIDRLFSKIAENFFSKVGGGNGPGDVG